MLHNAVEYYKENKLHSVVSTRDVYKAFDTVWWRGLLYKIFHLPGNQQDFTSLMYNYLIRRRITPYFEGHSSSTFVPKAGVPQGSSLGPILYLIYVNDIPAPIYNDTLISQFADDIVHFTVSDHRSKHIYNTNLIQKTQREHLRTLQWEENWKIKSNTDKNELVVHGVTSRTLTAAGGINIRNNTITTKENIRILGFQHGKQKTFPHHMNQLIHKATYNLHKLYRFKTAPPKIKLILYKTLIRPLMEYPSILLPQASNTNINKLQTIQNKALRFIYNTHWTDFISNNTLHVRANLETVKGRLIRLRDKAFQRYYNTITDEQGMNAVYIYSDYIIDEEPYFQPTNKLKSVYERLNIVESLNIID